MHFECTVKVFRSHPISGKDPNVLRFSDVFRHERALLLKHFDMKQPFNKFDPFGIPFLYSTVENLMKVI